jgi:hypothetical protein
MVCLPKLVYISSQPLLSNDVLTKKMVSLLGMVNAILQLLLPLEHQHINNLHL